MPKDNFVHLHVHSEYSLLDGACRIKDLVSEVKRAGMKAVALTDHGVMHGAVKFYSEATAHRLKPIVGAEAYLAPKSRFSKETREDRSPWHLTLLAKNLTGYRNLTRLLTAAHLEGFYAKPRLDREILARHREGLVVLSGCSKGEIPALLLEGKEREADEVADFFRTLFGEDFYLEIMDQNLPEQKIINPALVRLGRQMNIPLVATNDVHYVRPEETTAQDILLCIQTGKFIEDVDRMRFGTAEFYLKSVRQMQELFREVPEAVKATVAVAEKCDLKLEMGVTHLPHFPVPEGETADSYLERLCRQTIAERYGNDPKVEVRLAEELAVIRMMGYAAYFLVVQDFIQFARSRGIQVGPGRGSVAGSLVAYLLGITNVDPLKYGLIFERFLNPERKSLPDIDTDFCFVRRQEVIDYITRRYGADHVAQIVTFGTMAARAVVRDVGRVQKIPLAEVDRVAKLIPAAPDMTIEKALSISRELSQLAESDERIKSLLKAGQALEGVVRHASVHAAGVVISDLPLVESVPLMKMNENQIVTQYPMEDLEKIGLLKMDVLGLRNLTMIGEAAELIAKTRGLKIDIGNLALDDPKVYRLLSDGDTAGVFQLESRGMQRLLRELAPSTFEDIIAVLALYRPGPLESGMVADFVARKHGRVKVEYPLPELEPVLKATYGVILYQEQVMRIASEVSGFTMGQADVLRQAMGKKKPREMEEQKERFIEGAVKRGVSRQRAAELFSLIAKFAGYGFNRSHSTAYALVSYQTAHLKANYPAEFMASLLTSVMGQLEKVSSYITECSKMDIPVLLPEINESLTNFTVTSRGIRFGLGAIKNVGFLAVDSILKAREEGGKFKSLLDFSSRVDLRLVNRRVLESLIKCGAFDSLLNSRAVLLQRLEKTMNKAGLWQAERSAGQEALFSGLNLSAIPEEEDSPVTEDFLPEERLRMEKEMLGLYISGHPLLYVREDLEAAINTPLGSIPDKREGEAVVVGGILSGCRRITTRRRELMLTARLEDLSGTIPLILFPRTFEKYGQFMQDDRVVLVRGRIDLRNDEVKVVAEEVKPFEKQEHRRSLHLEARGTLQDMAAVKAVLGKSRGEEPVYFHLDGATVLAGRQFWVNIEPALVTELEGIVGEGAAWVDFSATESET